MLEQAVKITGEFRLNFQIIRLKNIHNSKGKEIIIGPLLENIL